MSTAKVCWIGALGGVSLALLKLVEAKFFLDQPYTSIVYAALLTYVAYIFFGVVVAGFFTDKELSDDKKVKQAFILGLLAPSVLLALASQPIGEKLENKIDLVQDIPSLSSVIIKEVYAYDDKCIKDILVKSDGSCVQVDSFELGINQPSVKDALLSVIGRREITEEYVFVLGRTKNANVAEEYVNKINQEVLHKYGMKDVSASIVYNKNGKELFVSIGGPDSAEKLVGLRAESWAAAVESLKADSSIESERLYKSILNGKIVDAGSLSRF